MARKKIGAIIALDGEREYKQAVTNCNRALNQFKAEMELVKAESEGQEESRTALDGNTKSCLKCWMHRSRSKKM